MQRSRIEFLVGIRPALLRQPRDGLQKNHQTGTRLGCQQLQNFSTKVLLIACHRGTHQAVDTIWRRRLQAQLPQTRQRSGFHAFRIPFIGQTVFVQPQKETVAISECGFTEAEQGTNLGAVVFDRPTLPVVAPPLGDVEAGLPGQIGVVSPNQRN